MAYLLLSAIVSLISSTSGTVDVEFLRGVPRLSDSSFWDYYFKCNAVGRTLQWEVNNTMFNEFTGGQVPQVLSGMTSNFSYIATLLKSSSELNPEQHFTFDSVLIVSCRGNISLNVICSNGSSSDNAEVDNRKGVENKTNSTSVFLDYLLTQKNIVKTGDSKLTSIFICGVENQFVTWQINRNDFSDIAFIEADAVGHQREVLQKNDTTVKQQVIRIGQEPYMLVTALFVIDNSELTITCGYSQNKVNLNIIIPVDPTLPETSTNTSFIGETTTSADNTSGINLGLVIVLSIIGGVVLSICLCCTILCFIKYRCINRKRIPKDIDAQEKELDQPRFIIDKDEETWELSPLDLYSQEEELDQSRSTYYNKAEALELSPPDPYSQVEDESRYGPPARSTYYDEALELSPPDPYSQVELLDKSRYGPPARFINDEDEEVYELSPLHSQSRSTYNDEVEALELRPPDLFSQVELDKYGPPAREKPVRDNDDNEIEEPKIIQDNIDYNAFSKRVQYIILTERSYEFRAARTIITAPDIEEGCRNITTIDNDIHVGMIGEHPVGLIQCNNEKDYADTLKNAIIKWFPNADYLVAVGVCTGFNCDKTSFADVLISNKIIVFEIGETGKEVKYSHEAIEMMPEIKRIFCSNPNKVDGKKVATNDRRAKHLVGKIASHPILFQSKRLMDLTQVYRKTYGGDLHSGELVSLQRNGIKMEDKSERSVQVMVIKAVSVYTDKKEQKDNWQDIGARAAFNYVKCKMILQPKKYPKPDSKRSIAEPAAAAEGEGE